MTDEEIREGGGEDEGEGEEDFEPDERLADAAQHWANWATRLARAAQSKEPLAFGPEARNWLIPGLQQLIDTISVVLDDFAADVSEQIADLHERVTELDERSRDARDYARTAAMATGVVGLLGSAHELSQRILASDLGEATQDLAQQILDATSVYARAQAAVAQAVGEAEAAPPPEGA